MRHSKLLLIVLLVSLNGCKDFRKADADELFIFSNELLSPTVENEKKYIKGSITYNGDTTLNDITVLSIATYKADPYQFKHTYMVYPTYTLSKGNKMNFFYELPDASSYIDKEIDIELSVYDYQNNKKLESKYLKVRGPLNMEVNVDDYRLSPLEINRFTTMSGKEVKETFLFDAIENKYILPIYHRIEPSIFSFKYQCDFTSSNPTAEMAFIDEHNLFPSIRTASSGYKVIPLSCSRSGDRMKFTFPKLYIEPNSLDMALSPYTGYRKTKYLYLPRNKQKEFNSYTFYLSVQNIGLNKIRFFHEFKIETLRPLIGSCDIATYCVVGGKTNE